MNEDLANALGFSPTLRCPHCGAAMYLGDHPDDPVCLNGCTLPHWMMREMNSELSAIARRQEYDRTHQKEES